MGQTSPMPVIRTGCRTPGRSLAIEGVPRSIASTWTRPNDSVELRLGTTRTSRAEKKSDISQGSRTPRNVQPAPSLSSRGRSLCR